MNPKAKRGATQVAPLAHTFHPSFVELLPATPYGWPEDLETKGKIRAALSAPFPEAAIQRTKAGETRKGYDTTGIGYSWTVQRLNEVLGPGQWRVEGDPEVEVGQTKRGARMFTARARVLVEFGRWDDADDGPRFRFWARAEMRGEHASMAKADAEKGAITNGLKKALGLLGVGWQAYAGALDPDEQPLPERPSDVRPWAGPPPGWNQTPPPDWGPPPGHPAYEEPRQRPPDGPAPESRPAQERPRNGQADPREVRRCKVRLTELVEALGKEECRRIRNGRPMETLEQMRAVVADLDKALEARIDADRQAEQAKEGVTSETSEPAPGAHEALIASYWALVEAAPADAAEDLEADLKELYSVSDPGDLAPEDLRDFYEHARKKVQG